jgi:uncharacterized RDD family membrane protein YckC
MRDDLPSPATSPELFEGILRRRVAAYIIDMVLVTLLTGFVLFGLGIAGLVTFGISWVLMIFAFPAVLIFYYASTLGSSSRATIGMKQMDIVLTPTRSRPLNGWRAIFHYAAFWIAGALFTPAIVVVGLFTQRRQLLHDLVVGTLMVRRSPMEAYWTSEAADQRDFGRRT